MKITPGRLLTGPAGTAQEILCELEPADARDWTAQVSNWFIDAPGQSVAWRHYMFSVVHLRPIDGGRAPHLKFRTATHEFLLMAMDPSVKPRVDDPKTWSYLQPVNLCEQVVLPSDVDAARLAEASMVGVTEGRLWAEPPLSGQAEPWRQFLNSTHNRGTTT